MKTFARLTLASVAVAALSMVSTPALAANNNVAPDIDFSLPYTDTFQYTQESMTVNQDGSYWICAEENAAPYGAYAFKFAVDSSGSDTEVQSINLNNDGNGCDDLAVDLSGNLFAALGSRIAVYTPDASGVASPARTITTPGLDIYTMSFDVADHLYVITGSEIWMYNPGASGAAVPDRQIDASGLSTVDYVAASVDGTVYVADYDNDNIDVFYASNNGPVWDRQLWLEPGADARSFGGLAINGTKLYVTYQDGSSPGIYVLPADGEGSVTATESWSGDNVVHAGEDAMFDIGVGGCTGEMIVLEGYNDRILTWQGLETECTTPTPTPDPELPNTGVDAGSLGVTGLAALGLVLAGCAALVIRRRANSI